MGNFSQEKNGYNKKEVDMYFFNLQRQLDESVSEINNLKSQIENLNDVINSYKQKEDIIAKSIEVAVQAGEDIKKQSKAHFKDEINNLKALYDKWNNFLTELKKQYPDTISDTQSAIILQSLIDAIDDVINNKNSFLNLGFDNIGNSCNQLKEYRKTIISNELSGSKDNFKNVIVRNKRPSQKTILKDAAEREHKKELYRLKTSPLEKLYKNSNLDINDQNFIDEFLSNAELENNNHAYNKEFIKEKFSNQTGFDLKEAVNPTMNLEEIMKAFDLED